MNHVPTQEEEDQLKKVLAKQSFETGRRRNDGMSFYVPKNELTGDVLCVKKAPKEIDCAFISFFF